MPNIAVPFEVIPTAAGMRADVRAGGIDKKVSLLELEQDRADMHGPFVP